MLCGAPTHGVLPSVGFGSLVPGACFFSSDVRVVAALRIPCTYHRICWGVDGCALMPYLAQVLRHFDRGTTLQRTVPSAAVAFESNRGGGFGDGLLGAGAGNDAGIGCVCVTLLCVFGMGCPLCVPTP